MAENERIQWVYSSKTNRELEDRYDEWASEYDSDLGGLGWSGPRAAAEVLARFVAPDAKILDAGAGTGLVGVELKRLGFNDITAIDISTGMLELARQTGAYKAVQREVLGETLGYGTDVFDAVISVGTLTIGHAPPDSLDELIRVTRSGGKIVFSMRPDHFEASGFKAKQEALEASGKWKLVERGEAFHPIAQEPDVEHEVWVYEVL
ncbi:MAG TPA: class I SAM-dependent methyltransferase [Dehalococcoidia bacterium]|nr:class I SAM-dependent methyltransferase [Dehalococcoidia bacterium]